MDKETTNKAATNQDKTELDIAELRRLAEAATPGPWTLTTKGNSVKSFAIEGVCSGMSPKKGDAKYIAAANPKTMLALLSRIAELQREVEALKEQLQSAQLNAELANNDREEARRNLQTFRGGRELEDEDLWAELKRDRDAATKRAEELADAAQAVLLENKNCWCGAGFVCAPCRLLAALAADAGKGTDAQDARKEEVSE